MSYCVNCGVELRQSEKQCPLCGTAVYNPNRPEEALRAEPAYPLRRETIDLKRKKQMTLLLATVIMALPAAVTLAVDYVINRSFSWSLYVTGSVAAFWVLILVPFFLPRTSELLCLALDYLAVNGLLYLVYRVSGTAVPWFRTLGAPLAAALALGALAGIIVMKRGPAKLTAAAAVAILSGVEAVAFEAITDRHLYGEASLGWSLVVLVACLFIALIFLLIGRKRRWKESIKKRIHI